MLDIIRYAKLNEKAITPTRKNPTDAGMDLYSCERVTIPSHSSHIVRTGISVEVPPGYMFLIKPKGRNAHLVGAGVVDALYHPGEILVKIVNFQPLTMSISIGEAIAQGVFIPIETPTLFEVPVEELGNSSSRSAQGGIVRQAK